jgi:hypothetical protein
MADGEHVSTTWGAQLTLIRRFLRDPNGTIWSDSFLRGLWNDVQQDFQHKTDALEDAIAQRVPGLYQFAYLFDWEWRHLSADLSQYYQALNQHDDGAFCHRWEPQVVTGIAADVSDQGAHFTQPWEACMGETPGDPIKIRFPRNYNATRFIAYDNEPIQALTQKLVQSFDASYLTTQGTPIGYYVWDAADNSYVLYPRPSVAFENEIEGEQVAQYADDDTENVNTGIIAVRTGSFDSEYGAPTDIVDTVNNVFLVYTISPREMLAVSDEPDFPAFLCKYIRNGVIGRAYSGNTDGRIRSLGDHWGTRYALGVQFTRRYLRQKKQDRNYRLTGRGDVARRRSRHPRLPDRYPTVDP